MSCEISTSLTCEILGVFGNTFTADHMYSRHRLEKLLEQIETLLSQKQKTFSAIFMAFSESIQSLAQFEIKRSAS